MCIRDDWRVDSRPLASASAGLQAKLDVECFTQNTFRFCNLKRSVGKEQNRCSASGVPHQHDTRKEAASSTR